MGPTRKSDLAERIDEPWITVPADDIGGSVRRSVSRAWARVTCARDPDASSRRNHFLPPRVMSTGRA